MAAASPLVPCSLPVGAVDWCICHSRRKTCSLLSFSDLPGNSPRCLRVLKYQAAKVRCLSMTTVIGPQSGEALFCTISSCAAFAQFMESKTKWGAQLSSPLMALLTGMALSGAGVIPSSAPSYDFVCSSIMPLAVAFYLLETDVQNIFTEAGPTLKAFWYGALGTLMGTVVSFKVAGHALGSDGWKIASSLCASYIGGTINYVATAQALGLTSSSTIAAGMAADNLAMAAYFAFIMAIPAKSNMPVGKMDEHLENTFVKPCSVETITISLAAATVACMMGTTIAAFLPSCLQGTRLAITALITSFISVVAAQVDKHTFAGSQNLGGSLMLLYFSVVGASAGFKDVIFGGWPLLAFICILITVHLIVIMLLGRQSMLPTKTILVASNANIGGPATAAAMASCRGWQELVKPAILVGTLGYTIATAIGCLLGMHILQFMR